MEQSGSVIKIRPAEMELAVPGFQPSVVSSPANVFVQSVLAQSYDENRIVWNYRSPSSHLLCSPLVFGVFRIKITTPYKLNKASQVGPLLGYYDTNVVLDEATADATPMGVADGAVHSKEGYGYRPMFAFGSQNAVMNAIESKSITINGSTWSELNSNLYLRSLDKCYVPDDQMQRSCSTCGGTGNKGDSVPLSGHVLGLPDGIGVTGTDHGVDEGGLANTKVIVTVNAGAAGAVANINSRGFTCTEGATMDSGLAQRMNNFYDQIIKVADDPAGAARGKQYTLEIKFPISGSVFNDQFGAQGLARSDPRLRMALGLPHINSGQIVLQFKELFKTLIRRFGRPNELGVNNALAGAVSAFADATQVGSDVSIEFDSSYAPQLRMTYIRLPSFRSYPDSAALTVYRREIRRPTGTRNGGQWGEKIFNAGLWGGPKTGSAKGLRCAGDFYSLPSNLTVRPPDRTIADHKIDVSWSGVQFPQPPSYIFICYQKDPAYMTYDNPLQKIAAVDEPGATHANKWRTKPAGAQNAAFANLAAANIAVKTYAGAGSRANTFNQELAARNIAQSQDSNAAILQLEITVQSAIGSFTFKDSEAPYLQDRDVLWRKHVRNTHSQYCPKGRGAWQDRECCALLASSDYLLGLQTSPGTQFPITLDVQVNFANRAAYRGGACFTTGISKGQMCFEDIMIGEPTLVGLFHQNVMTIAASSAVLSSQAFSQATSAAALASS